MDRLTLYGSFTSSSSYKPMLYLALARLPFSFRTVNLKTGAQKTPEYLATNRWGVVPSLRHRGLTILQSNVILDYLARPGTSRAERSNRGGRRASGCPGRPTTSLTSPRYAIQHGFAPPIPRRSPSIVRGQRQRCALSTILSRTSRFWLVILAQSLTSDAGAAWCSWPKAGSISTTGLISRLGRGASRRCRASRCLTS
jgi:Glutathione S-transferase, N-terminal domain